jgi:hypothetical protein
MDQEIQLRETEVTIDLEEELGLEEIASFREEAERAGASSLSEHFKNVFLRPRVS